MSERSLVETHTIDALEVSASTHAEITRLLREAGRDSRFHLADRGILIDMSGLGLVVKDGPDGLDPEVPA